MSCPNCFAVKVVKGGEYWYFLEDRVRFCPKCGHRLDRRVSSERIPKRRLLEIAREYVHPVKDNKETLMEQALIDVLARFGARVIEEQMDKH